MLGAYTDSTRPADIRGNGLAQFGQPLRGPVMRPALIQRLLAGLDDMARRVEVGLADFQVNDAVSLRFQRPRAHQDFEGGFHAYAVHPLS